MVSTTSYVGKKFRVTDADCRIRAGADHQAFAKYAAGDAIPPGKRAGDFVTIAKGTDVTVDAVEVGGGRIFANTLGEGERLGWTSVTNFGSAFLNETFGEIAPEDNKKKGRNALWRGGEFLGQATLVNIVGEHFEPELVVLDFLEPYMAMAAAATTKGVPLSVRDGFRTFGDQQHLFDGFMQKRPGFNLAAAPGKSNHQDGRAFDLSVGGFDGDPVYDWLKQNAPSFGFVRTVSGEPWHWEHRPQAARNGFKLASVRV